MTTVADAAGNDILAITDSGVQHGRAAAPGQGPGDQELRKQLGARLHPGQDVQGEPVPTDVEVGPDGNLYVTTLGGGLGEQMPVGAVYRIVLGTAPSPGSPTA